MTIEKLEYFYTIAKYNSISKAASELHVSKSTLSASLKDLESELGHLLFDRNGNSLTLNSYGDKIVQSVYIILNEAKKMKLNLHEMIENPVMRLGFGNTSLMYKVTENEDQLNRFWECYHGSSFELLNKLENHELDFVITSADVNSPVLKKEQLIELKMYLCVSREIKQEIGRRLQLFDQLSISIFASSLRSFRSYQECARNVAINKSACLLLRYVDAYSSH